MLVGLGAAGGAGISFGIRIWGLLAPAVTSVAKDGFQRDRPRNPVPTFRPEGPDRAREVRASRARNRCVSSNSGLQASKCRLETHLSNGGRTAAATPHRKSDHCNARRVRGKRRNGRVRCRREPVVLAGSCSEAFSYTKAVEQWQVPDGVAAIKFTARGAGGGGPWFGGLQDGGSGAKVTSIWPLARGTRWSWWSVAADLTNRPEATAAEAKVAPGRPRRRRGRRDVRVRAGGLLAVRWLPVEAAGPALRSRGGRRG